MAVFGEQFSSGDQSAMKKELWELGFQTCPACKEKKIKGVTHGAGCRMNGDAYGTEVFTCTNCAWSTSFQWDEASETYYYETQFWKRKDDVRSWGVSQIRKLLEDNGMDEIFVKTCEKEAVDGEVLFRHPPILTRSFMANHVKWKVSDETINKFAEVYKKITKKELQDG